MSTPDVERSWQASVTGFVASGAYRRAIAVVAAIYGDVEQAEDAVTEALTRACEREARGEVVRDWQAWVVKVALNDCASLSRRLRRAIGSQHLVARAESDADGGADAAGRVVEANDTLVALHRLPQRQREALVLHYYADMSVAEAAELLGTTSGAVKAALHKGRTQLSTLLSREATRHD